MLHKTLSIWVMFSRPGAGGVIKRPNLSNVYLKRHWGCINSLEAIWSSTILNLSTTRKVSSVLLLLNSRVNFMAYIQSSESGSQVLVLSVRVYQLIHCCQSLLTVTVMGTFITDLWDPGPSLLPHYAIISCSGVYHLVSQLSETSSHLKTREERIMIVYISKKNSYVHEVSRTN